MNDRRFSLTIGVLLLACHARAALPMKTKALDFTFDGKRLSGVLDLPATTQPSAIVIFVHGHGRTDAVAGKWYYDLRSRFAELGLASYVWDKAGCGRSGGEYDHGQSVQNGAREVLAAISELKRRRIAGSQRIGLWGISRAGWICPLVIEQLPTVAFWISVSGTDDKESFGYLLETNLRIEGRSESEARSLAAEWRRGNDVFRKGGSWEEHQRATRNLRKLRQDPLFKSLMGEEGTEEGYLRDQKAFIAENHPFDESSGLMIYVPGFRELLGRIRCPVLALFGESDSIVNWRRTRSLYKDTLGSGKNPTLTVRTFPECSHAMQQCKTCGIREDRESTGGRQPCHGYYEAMTSWIKEKGFARSSGLGGAS